MKYDIVTKLDHDYIIDELKATCLAEGDKDVTCSRCDYHTHEIYSILFHLSSNPAPANYVPAARALNVHF